MKKISIILTVGMLTLLSISCVQAAEEKYKSTINMQGGTTLTGSGRDFKYEKHKIAIKPTELGFAYYNTYNRVDITLQRKGLFGYGDKKTVTAKLSEVGKTYSYEMGSHSKGKFRYVFFTNTNHQPWAGVIKADPVYMYSYE